MLGFWPCASLDLLRCDELIKLQCNNIMFNEQGMVVKIVSSKTDQFREGADGYKSRVHQYLVITD